MSVMNIEMNLKNQTGYDQLNPKTNVTVVDGAAPKSIGVLVTATTEGWVGTAAPFTQNLTVAGITADNNFEIALASSSSFDELNVASKSFIQCTAQGENFVTLTAYKKKPTTNLLMQIIIFG